jgi:transporter family-2 protein
MKSSFALYLFLGLFAGALIPLQTSFNAVLGKRFPHPILPSAIVCIVSALYLMAVVLVLRPEVPSMEVIRETPWLGWVGGAFGGTYILCLVFLVPRLGVGLTTVSAVFGQVLMGAALDHVGAFGMPKQEMSWVRFLAIVLMGSGVILFRRVA